MVVNNIASALHRCIVYYKQFLYGYVNIAHLMESVKMDSSWFGYNKQNGSNIIPFY